MRKKYRPFKEARKFVQSLKLKSNKKWRVYCRSGKRPADIPTNPNRIYKKEWTTWGDWLGTGTLSPTEISKRRLPPIEAKIEARKIAKKLKIKEVYIRINRHQNKKEFRHNQLGFYFWDHCLKKAKEDGKRASIVTQERPNIFKQSIANIMPNDTINVIRFVKSD